jgi:hypothetical protein
MEEEGAKKRPLELDWDKLLPSQDDDDVPLEVIVKTTHQSAMGSDQRQSDEDLQGLSTHYIQEQIDRKRRTLETLGPKLADKGDKIRRTIKRLQDELDRREHKKVSFFLINLI